MSNGTSLALQTGAELGYSRSQVDLIKDTIARGATDQELALFLHIAHRSGLDPMAKQIYLIKRWDSQLKREIATPQTGIDGFRLIADRTERYAPGRAPTLEYDTDGMLLSATAYVKKWVRGEWHEIAATAYYDEYVQTTKEGGANRMWRERPRLMLAKCAESLALRRAFPAELSGLYTSDEMGRDVEVAPSLEEAAARPTVRVLEVRPQPADTPPLSSDTPPPASANDALIARLKLIRDGATALGLEVRDMKAAYVRAMNADALAREIATTRSKIADRIQEHWHDMPDVPAAELATDLDALEDGDLLTLAADVKRRHDTNLIAA